MTRVYGRIAAAVAACALIGVTLLPRGAAAVIVRLEADAWTYASAPTSNQGKSTNLEVAGPTGLKQTFIQFDLSTLPAGTTSADVKQATLTLFANTVSTVGSFDVVRVTSTWTEAGITAGSAPTLGSTEHPAVPVSVKNTFTTVDVTAVVKAWADGSLANNGLALVPNAPGGVKVYFDSKENSSRSHPAQLDITLSDVHEDAFNYNMFIGDGVGAAATGDHNTGVGELALHANTPNTGSANTAVGSFALEANTGGNQNTAVGHYALPFNTTGDSNTAVGQDVLQDNNGSNNTAVGEGALLFNTTGSNNTAVGQGALENSTGSGNIAVGQGAASVLTSGSNNIFIGNPGVNASESNIIRIGDTSVHTGVRFAGINGAAVASGTPVYVNTSGVLGTTIPSSRRFKDDVQNMGAASNGLLRLRPVTFRYKPEVDDSGARQYGLIAEEVAEVFPDLVIRDKQGDVQGVRYDLLSTLLLNELQKQAHTQETLAAELEQQRNVLDRQLRDIDTLKRQNADEQLRNAALQERLERIERSVQAAAGERGSVASAGADGSSN